MTRTAWPRYCERTSWGDLPAGGTVSVGRRTVNASNLGARCGAGVGRRGDRSARRHGLSQGRPEHLGKGRLRRGRLGGRRAPGREPEISEGSSGQDRADSLLASPVLHTARGCACRALRACWIGRGAWGAGHPRTAWRASGIAWSKIPFRIGSRIIARHHASGHRSDGASAGPCTSSPGWDFPVTSAPGEERSAVRPFGRSVVQDPGEPPNRRTAERSGS